MCISPAYWQFMATGTHRYAAGSSNGSKVQCVRHKRSSTLTYFACYSILVSLIPMLFLFQVTVKEPQSIHDPTANVFLTVSRSSGGQGEVQILWKLEESASYDLTPLNGTLLFSEVRPLFPPHFLNDVLLFIILF